MQRLVTERVPVVVIAALAAVAADASNPAAWLTGIYQVIAV